MNNKVKLIPRKLIGGLIPKFKNTPGKLMTRLEYERRYSNRNYNKAYMLNGKWQRAILNRDKNGNETVTLQTWKPLPENYYVKNGGIYEKTGLGDIRVDTYKGSRYESGKPALDHKRPVDRSITLAEINEVKASNANSKPTNQNQGTKGGATSGAGRKASLKPASRTTTLPPVGTASLTDLSKMSAEQLQARNDAMTRGYRDYFFNGLRYSFTGEDLTNAENNWKINRGRLNSGAKGLLGLPSQFTGKIEEAKPLTETFSDPNAPKEITIPADFTPEMFTQAFRNKWIADPRLRAIPAENVQEISYNKPFVMHFGADRNWNGMTDEQKLNYLQTMDKAIDPSDKTFSIYDINGNLVLNQSENSSFGPLTLSELYNADKGAFNDYMNNFRGKAWDTATDEGSKTYKGMLDYYNLNRKAVDKYARKQKWQANSPEVFNYLYTQYNNTLPKARKGTKLIPRNGNIK